ncbi:MAG: 2-hydroxychromene-2-carboxylate isomerase [Rubrivivax sp.]|nr:2-hydroxychromene-2-carboxylate isomerase [Rubrivivax sp.]
MSLTVDYYLAPQSPWTYLGHARFVRMAAEAGATVKLKVVDLGKVFPVSGGLPLAQRPPQRQAYRLVELARWRDALGLPMNIQPRFFPVQGQAAARLIVAVDAADGTAAALALAGRVLAAVWAQERNIADPATLAELLAESGLPAARLDESAGLQPVCDAHTQAAIDAGVFGAPSYVIDGELFWGQDRLDFVQRRLQAPSSV